MYLSTQNIVTAFNESIFTLIVSMPKLIEKSRAEYEWLILNFFPSCYFQYYFNLYFHFVYHLWTLLRPIAFRDRSMTITVNPRMAILEKQLILDSHITLDK